MIQESKICLSCKEEKSLDKFYSNGYQPNGKKKYKPTCKACQDISDTKNFILKIETILMESNRLYECEMCGYDKNTAALCFHHLDPSEKEFGLNSCKTFSIERLRLEIEKCVVLCHNCHMEEHYPHLTKNSR